MVFADMTDAGNGQSLSDAAWRAIRHVKALQRGFGAIRFTTHVHVGFFDVVPEGGPLSTVNLGNEYVCCVIW